MTFKIDDDGKERVESHKDEKYFDYRFHWNFVIFEG
jgi:hypothetical protein